MTDTNGASRRTLPVGLDVRGRRCVVVGGGRIGTRKVKTLIETGADVVVISPEITVEIQTRVDTKRVEWQEERFRDDHLDGAFLVVTATDDPALNERVVRAAAARGALVCDASSADRSSVTFGALLEHDGTTIAVFTGGRDPTHARRMRDRIAALVGRRSSDRRAPDSPDPQK